MLFKGRELKDWQEQVWDAKRKIYQETMHMDFTEYLKYIHKDVSPLYKKLKIGKRSLAH